MQNETPKNTRPSLLEVQLTFAHWRKRRSHPREAAPEHLHQLAIGLLCNTEDGGRNVNARCGTCFISQTDP